MGLGDVAETKKEQKGYSKYLDKGEDGKWYDKETGKTYDTVDDWLKAQETLAKRYEGAADYYQKKADKAWARYKNAESNGDSADKKSQNYLESKKCYEKAKECREKAAAIREKIGQQPKSEEVSVSDKNNEYKDNKKHNETEEQKDVGDKQRKDGSNAEKNSERETEKETRELTDEEKQWLKDTLGWSDKQIDKCTIDKDGVIHYRTDRSDLEGKTSENGVPYERKQIVINGVRIEGVFPNFDSVYTTELSPEKQKSNAYAKECNANLKEAVNNDPELRKKFTKEQLEDIENGRTPTGYVWHHNEEQGKMELVKKEDHDRTSGGAAHTGGSVLWGPDSSASKGDKF